MKTLNTLLVAIVFLCSPLVQADADSDRIELIELMNRYAWGVDTLEKKTFETVFLNDATAYYLGVGENAKVLNLNAQLNGLDEIYSWIVKGVGHRKGHAGLPWHFITNHLVDLKGDTAKVAAYMHNRPMAAGGVYYVDAVRTKDGWRIKHLKLEEQLWINNYYKN